MAICRPPPPLITWTGLTGLLLAPFGGYAFNLAAITAAICMGKEGGSRCGSPLAGRCLGGRLLPDHRLFPGRPWSPCSAHFPPRW